MEKTMNYPIIKIMLILLFINAIIFFTTCKHTTEPLPEAELTLTLEDVSCTEAWIMLKLTNISLPTEVTLYKNNSAAQNNILCYGDTLLYIDSLLPNQNYSFYAVVQPSSRASNFKSNELSVTTLDTTSHNFTFQSWTFGTIGSSTLYDVAIIDENNIWAVGEINVADTSINGYTTYNAVHWNGTEWELKKIYTYSACSSVDYAPLKSIYAFSENSLVVTSGGGMWWYDGTTWKAECSINPLLTGAINKLWGSSSNDLYAVGNGGNIAHWDGRKWTKIESGTDSPIVSILGVKDSDSDYYEILCTTDNTDGTSGQSAEIIKIRNNKAEIIQGLEISTCCLMDLWFKPEKKYIVVGAGMWESNQLTKDWREITISPPTVKTSIAANDYNEIIVVGSFQTLAHWNGYSWYNYFPLTPGPFSAVEMKSNLFVAVGSKSNKAYILIGRK